MKIVLNILKFIGLYIGLMIVFFLALLLVSFIPKGSIEKNSVISSRQLLNETEKVYYQSFDRQMQTDNSSDAIMLNIVYSMDDDNKLESIMKCKRNYVPGVTTEVVEDVKGNLLHNSSVFSMVNELYETTEGIDIEAYEYARYWHGYIVLLRPMLVFFNYEEIVVIINMIITVLFTILLVNVYKKKGWITAIGVFLAFIAIDFLQWYHTIMGIFVMMIALASSAIISTGIINRKNLNVLLFIESAIISYLDLLTFPMVGFVVPVVIYNLFNDEDEKVLKRIGYLIGNGIICILGYALTWVAKLVISDFLVGTEVLDLAFKQALFRAGITVTTDIYREYIIRNMFRKNMYYGFTLVDTITISILSIYGLYCLFKHSYRYYLTKKKIVYYLCVALPFIWYRLLLEHSFLHFFFTYRNLLITYLCLFLIYTDNPLNSKNEKEKEK